MAADKDLSAWKGELDGAYKALEVRRQWAQARLDAAQKKKLLVQMGYMYRYNPAVVLLRQMLDRGWLGEPFEVHTVMSKVVAPAERTILIVGDRASVEPKLKAMGKEVRIVDPDGNPEKK